MEKQDHDTLIRVETKVETLCKVIAKMDTKLDKQQAACSCRMADCSKRFTSSKLFYWFAGLVIGALIFMGGAVLRNKSFIDILHHEDHKEVVMLLGEA